ncbi:MAG: hypothetical protein ACK4WC_15445 [Rubrimonas sp.]
MPRARHLFLCAVIGAAGAAAAADEWFVTSGGVRVHMPPVAELNCAQMLDVLVAIDGSGYRGVASVPGDAADAKLLAYENRVSRRYYADCVNAPGSLHGADGAFAYGFEDDDAPAQGLRQ